MRRWSLGVGREHRTAAAAAVHGLNLVLALPVPLHPASAIARAFVVAISCEWSAFAKGGKESHLGRQWSQDDSVF